MRFSLHIEPRPAGTAETLDIEGNETLVAWFDGLTDCLVLEARTVVETLRDNPFDFLWLGDRTLPMQYPPELRESLYPYLQHSSVAALQQYAAEAAAGSKGDPQSFLLHLTNLIHDGCRYVVRPEGDPLPPEETLRRGEGACRDLAVLFVAICRELGVAARFVSGYGAADGVEENELHAWAEVYLPGGGWRGFDPSAGMAVADSHIAVAAGASPEHAAPVAGGFRGSATSLPIETTLTVRRLD